MLYAYLTLTAHLARFVPNRTRNTPKPSFPKKNRLDFISITLISADTAIAPKVNWPKNSKSKREYTKAFSILTSFYDVVLYL
jgi:hypothetical protein